jgi:putative heme-binding domain-containing protein
MRHPLSLPCSAVLLSFDSAWSLRMWRLLLLCVCLQFSPSLLQAQQAVQLQPGARIAVIGNTLADRMQHAGWLETLLQAAYPQHKLVLRDLGFSGDSLTERPRSDNFGSPDEWLTKVRADVIIACFGYNESWAGAAGLEKFRGELTAFVKQVQGQQYNGRSAPQVVLCSPTWFEDLRLAELPDGVEANTRLELYTAEMGRVAAGLGLPFVNLFQATREAAALAAWDGSVVRNLAGVRRDRFGRAVPESAAAKALAGELTLNGVHLNDRGNQVAAEAIVRSGFGVNPGALPADRLLLIRRAVLAKNLYWHNVYRATDGYSVFGGRSGLQFVEGQTNFVVMQRELEILTEMTARRDAVIWAAANGQQSEPDDANLPQPLGVRTNKPGELEGGRHKFLGGAEAIEKMTVHAGMKVNLFASEEMFSDLVNPVQSAVDPDGRLWVAAWPTYPHWNPLEAMNDKLLILPDDNADGVADRCITFADGLHNPTGFEFWNGGVLVAMAPDIWFLKDTDGDDRADVRERIFHGLDSADTHHTANAFVMSPAGKFYFSRGIFHAENFETPWGPTKRFGTGGTGVYEWDPVTFDINFHFPIGPNPHGDVFDQWGNQFATDGTGGTGNFIGMPGRGAPAQLYEKRVRPVPAICILDSQHFAEENRGNLLIANVIGFQGVTQYRFEKRGAGFFAREVEPILYSSDQNFRPSDMEIGGDGALYVLDWQNPIIGHMQHNLRDPSRDHLHGRIYRVTAEGRPVQPTLQLSKAATDAVVRSLGSPVLAERYRARLELTGRDQSEVAAAVAVWRKRMRPDAAEDARSLVEALWATQRARRTDFDLLQGLLESPQEDARAAAVRVLRDLARDVSWRKRAVLKSAAAESVPGRAIPVVLDESAEGLDVEAWERLLLKRAVDASPQVRAEAVVAASFTRGPLAAEILFAAMQTEQDQQLTFVIQQARGVIDLDGAVRGVLAGGGKLSRNAEAYALSNASVEDLLKMEKTEGVYRAILTRESVPEETLRAALTGLAGVRKVAETEELFALIEELNAKASVNVLNSLSRLLAAQPADQLVRVRDRIVKLAKSARSAETRRVALSAWISADGNGDAVFAAMAEDQVTREDVLRALPLVTSKSAQAALFPKLAALLPTLAGSRGAAALVQPGLRVDFYAPNPANVARETLEALTPSASGVAEKIVMDQPILKTRDGFALMFRGHIRIEKAGRYVFFISSDDGSRFYIDGELLIDNDGLHGMVEKRGEVRLEPGLHPIVATYFDNGGGDGLGMSWSGPGLRKQEIPAEVLVSAAEQTLQDLGVVALSQLPGFEGEKTAVLAGLLQSGASTGSVLTALAAIPEDRRPEAQAAVLGAGAVKYLAGLEPRQRNTDAGLVALGLAESAGRRLSGAARLSLERQLSEVVVPLIALGTVPERMIYDREIVAVQAGRPVEFRLSNTDNMPHNLAIVKPGTMAAVGELAESTGRDADAAERGFVPRTDSVLAASELVQPGKVASVYFETPSEPGIYPYVCTYPGHWRRMYGALYVVADLRAYESDPAGYLAAAKLEQKDELLKYLGRNTEWQLDDLAGDVMHLTHRANSFAVGQQLFRAAACVGCHRMNGQGVAVGPDLAKLPAEYSRLDILDHILNPSKKIEPKYQSSVIVLSSGKVVTGLVLEDAGGELKVLDNPAAPDKLVAVKKSEIEERSASEVSIMPKGVLNKLTREEILDLLAWVVAGGDREHVLFKEHEHHK